MNGKGDTPRPMSVKKEQFDDNWDRIFNKRIVDELTELSQEIGLYDAPKRSDVNEGEFPRLDEDGNAIEWTAC